MPQRTIVIYSCPKIYDQDTNMEIDIFIRIQKTFTNVHKHRSPKNTKHWRLSFGSGMKLLITFCSLRFFDMRRERHNFFLCWLFHLTPPRVAPHHKLLVWPWQAPKINFLPLASNLNSLFFSNSKILSPSLPGMTSFTSLVSFPISGFYCDICDCHIRPVHVNTCTQCVHLTNPCTKPKGSQLTKLKGKIYKTINDNIKKILPQLYNTIIQQSVPLTLADETP